MKAYLSVALFNYFVIIEAAQPKSVNVALETIFSFDEKGSGSQSKVFEEVQDFLSKVKTVLKDETTDSNVTVNMVRKSFGIPTIDFTDLLDEVVNILISMNNRDLINVVSVIDDELNKLICDKCNIPEILENKILRISLKHSLEIIKGTKLQNINKTFIKLLKCVDDMRTDKYGLELLEYLNHIYKDIEGQAFMKILLNLQVYKTKSKISKTELEQIIRQGFKEIVVNYYFDLSTATKKELKLKIEKYFLGDKENIDAYTQFTKRTDEKLLSISRTENYEMLSNDFIKKAYNKRMKKNHKIKEDNDDYFTWTDKEHKPRKHSLINMVRKHNVIKLNKNSKRKHHRIETISNEVIGALKSPNHQLSIWGQAIEYDDAIASSASPERITSILEDKLYNNKLPFNRRPKKHKINNKMQETALTTTFSGSSYEMTPIPYYKDFLARKVNDEPLQNVSKVILDIQNEYESRIHKLEVELADVKNKLQEKKYLNLTTELNIYPTNEVTSSFIQDIPPFITKAYVPVTIFNVTENDKDVEINDTVTIPSSNIDILYNVTKTSKNLNLSANATVSFTRDELYVKANKETNKRSLEFLYGDNYKI